MCICPVHMLVQWILLLKWERVQREWIAALENSCIKSSCGLDKIVRALFQNFSPFGGGGKRPAEQFRFECIQKPKDDVLRGKRWADVYRQNFSPAGRRKIPVIEFVGNDSGSRDGKFRLLSSSGMISRSTIRTALDRRGRTISISC